MENRLNLGSVLRIFFQVILVVLLLSTVILALVQVFSRYVIEKNAKGVEELARLSIVWGSILGTSYVYMFDKLITVDIVKEKIQSKKVLSFISYLVVICVFIVSVIFIISGMKYVLRYWVYPDLSTSLLFPRSLFFLPIPISGVMMFVSSIVKIVKMIMKGGGE